MPKSKVKTTAIRAIKPLPPLLKPIKVDWRGVFKGLAKAVANTATMKLADAGASLVEATCALDLKTKPEELLHRLVLRSVVSAVAELVAETAPLLVQSADEKGRPLTEALGQSLEKLGLDVPADFFAHPGELPILESLEPLLTVWFTMHELPAPQAVAVSRRLRGYFCLALYAEWQMHPAQYEPLRKLFDNPFVRAADREHGWDHYAVWLKRRTEESVFGEAFSLHDIFVEPHAFYYQQTKKGEAKMVTAVEEVSSEGKTDRVRVVVPYRDTIDKWSRSTDPKQALRVVCGDPGCGKSSAARIFAADIASKGKRVIFIELHMLDPRRSVAGEITRLVREQGILHHDPLDPQDGDNDLLVIFDGLDELASQGKAAAETARDFVQEVRQLLEGRNQTKVRLRVLLCGRTPVVEASETHFREEGTVIELLPYFVPEAQRQNGWKDPGKLLQKDLRVDWWEQYGSLTGLPYSGLPDELRGDDFTELTAQPLLNYLLALSMSRGNIDFKKAPNLNVIYEDLIRSVHERAYAGNRRHRAIEHMNYEDFLRMLEEVGLATWHGDSRSTTIQAIQRHCETSGVGHLLTCFQQGAEAGVTNLLAAFFFRQHDKNAQGDRTFVFTHKSFGEYLTARRFVRGMAEIAEEHARYKREHKGIMTTREALRFWARICGPSAVTGHLLRLVRNELLLQDEGIAADWQNEFASLFGVMLREGMPIEMLNLATFNEANRQARNSEEAVMVAVNVCACRTRKMTQIEWPSLMSFADWLKRVQPQRNSFSSVAVYACFSYLNLENAVLHGADLVSANFDHSNLAKAELGYAWAMRATFSGAILDKARCGHGQFMGAHFTGTSMKNSDLSNASLESAYFFNAKLNETNFHDTCLRGCNFRESIMIKANFTASRVAGSSFCNNDLQGAKFENATGLPGSLLGNSLDTARDVPSNWIELQELNERQRKEESAKQEQLRAPTAKIH